MFFILIVVVVVVFSVIKITFVVVLRCCHDNVQVVGLLLVLPKVLNLGPKTGHIVELELPL